MNKELINKYKPEFDHWLNEGKLLYKHTNSNAWRNDEPWDYSPDYVTAIIINDEYVEFRKALVEGKTVQANINYWSFPETEKFNWQDIASPDSFNKFNLLNLRIKSDEPKFKVGDFVTPLNREINCSIWSIDNILSCNTLVSGSTMLDPRTIQLWTPVKGEWCWFFNDDRIPTISQFVEMDNDITRKYFAVYPNRPKALGSWYKKCEPFLNSLPSYLKDK